MRLCLALALGAGLMAVPCLAQGPISLTSAVFVERMAPAQSARTVVAAKAVARGDRVLLVVEWRTGERGKGFQVTSPLAPHLAYEGSAREDEEVSVDGGRNWGRIDALTIRDEDGLRRASPRDVTHLRWSISPAEAARGSGRITYSALVR